MKTTMLLNFLQNSAKKVSRNYKKTASRKNDAGFTILELLVIVIILGILASIAAPGWLGFINRQRVRTVNDRVFQSLRLAQSEAKRTKGNVTITFNNPANDSPTVTFDPPLPTGGPTQTLNAGGEIKPGTIQLTFSKPDSTDPKKSSLTFDYQGNPDKTSFIVAVAAVNGGGKQCAIVETLIGGMRTGEGETECKTTP